MHWVLLVFLFVLLAVVIALLIWGLGPDNQKRAIDCDSACDELAQKGAVCSSQYCAFESGRFDELCFPECMPDKLEPCLGDNRIIQRMIDRECPGYGDETCLLACETLGTDVCTSMYCSTIKPFVYECTDICFIDTINIMVDTCKTTESTLATLEKDCTGADQNVPCDSLCGQLVQIGTLNSDLLCQVEYCIRHGISRPLCKPCTPEDATGCQLTNNTLVVDLECSDPVPLSSFKGFLLTYKTLFALSNYKEQNNFGDIVATAAVANGFFDLISGEGDLEIRRLGNWITIMSNNQALTLSDKMQVTLEPVDSKNVNQYFYTQPTWRPQPPTLTFQIMHSGYTLAWDGINRRPGFIKSPSENYFTKIEAYQYGEGSQYTLQFPGSENDASFLVLDFTASRIVTLINVRYTTKPWYLLYDEATGKVNISFMEGQSQHALRFDDTGFFGETNVIAQFNDIHSPSFWYDLVPV